MTEQFECLVASCSTPWDQLRKMPGYRDVAWYKAQWGLRRLRSGWWCGFMFVCFVSDCWATCASASASRRQWKLCKDKDVCFTLPSVQCFVSYRIEVFEYQSVLFQVLVASSLCRRYVFLHVVNTFACITKSFSRQTVVAQLHFI